MILRYQEKYNYIINSLSDYAIKLGFGNKSGLDLNYEISGKIPNVKRCNNDFGRSGLFCIRFFLIVS